MYRLVFLNKKFKGKRVAVKQGAVLIGRSPDCHLDLEDDDQVSRHHAILEIRAEGIFIRDLGSMNKIQVNGKKVEECRLAHGDEIEIGGTRFQYQTVQETVATARRRPGGLQILTLVAITLVLALEAIFLARMSLWRSGDLSASLSFRPEAPSPSVEEVIREAKRTAPKPKAPPKARPPAAAPASVTATSAPALAVEHEVKQLREEMEGLRQQIEGLAVSPEPVAPAPKPDPRPPAPAPIQEAPAGKAPKAPAPPPEDTVTLVAREMLKTALKEIAGNNLRAADQQLERIQIMAPDFVPAYVERGRVQERLGNKKKAGEHWGEVLKRSVGTPLYAEAAAERIRLARSEMTAVAERPSARDANPFGVLPKRIKIEQVEAEKFQSNEEFDEMRLLRVELRAKLPAKEVDTDEVKVEVRFFDRDQNSGDVGPTRVMVPEDNWQVEGVWPSRESRTVTAAYIVPKGFRVDEEDDYAQKRSYYGFVVKLYYLNELQDISARPKNLLELAQKMESAASQSVVPAE